MARVGFLLAKDLWLTFGRCSTGFQKICKNVNLPFSIKRQFFRKIHRTCPYRSENQSNQSRLLIYGGILTAIGIKKKDDQEEEEDVLIHTIKLGMLSLQKEEFNTAEQILHAALKIAQERIDSQAVTYIYDMLANVAFQKGDLKKAETLFVEVMKRMIVAGTPKEDNAIIELSLKMATIFDQQKQFDKAEEGYQFCLKTQKEKIDKIKFSQEVPLNETEQDTVLLWAMTTDWYGRHLLALGRLQEAQENFVKAYELSETVNGPMHHQTLVLLNDIGSIASLRENYDEAIQYLEKAIEKGKVGDTPDIAAFYCNLGATYMKKGDYTQALKSCQQGLTLAKRTEQKDAVEDAQDCLKELKKLGVK